MPLELDENIEDDIFYQRGFKKGMEIGIQMAIELERKEWIITMLQEGTAIPVICRIMKTTEEFVLNIKKENSL